MTYGSHKKGKGYGSGKSGGMKKAKKPMKGYASGPGSSKASVENHPKSQTGGKY